MAKKKPNEEQTTPEPATPEAPEVPKFSEEKPALKRRPRLGETVSYTLGDKSKHAWEERAAIVTEILDPWWEGRLNLHILLNGHEYPAHKYPGHNWLHLNVPYGEEQDQWHYPEEEE